MPKILETESKENKVSAEVKSSSTTGQNMDASPHHKWWHPLVAGSVSGTFGGYACYPFEGWKKRRQSGQVQPKPWEIKKVYTGANAFALSLAPVSMVQVTVHSYLKSKLPENAPTYMQNTVGVISGSLGAFASAPVEHIILTQQKQNIGPIKAIKYLLGRGITYPWTALSPLMVREAGFGFTMLMGADIVADKLSKKFDRDLNLVGNIGTGLFGAAITHPFDATATQKQVSPDRISMWKAAKQIYTEKGAKGFCAGYAYRAFLFTGCSIVIGKTNKLITAHLEQQPEQKQSPGPK